MYDNFISLMYLHPDSGEKISAISNSEGEPVQLTRDSITMTYSGSKVFGIFKRNAKGLTGIAVASFTGNSFEFVSN